MTAQKKRIDRIIDRMCEIRNTLESNFDVEFGIDHLLTVNETAVTALEVEINRELEDE